MRNDMLFIDGKLVDLDDNTKITLNFIHRTRMLLCSLHYWKYL